MEILFVILYLYCAFLLVGFAFIRVIASSLVEQGKERGKGDSSDE